MHSHNTSNQLTMILKNFSIRDIRIMRRFFRHCRSKARKKLLNKVVCVPTELTEVEKKKESIFRKHYMLDIEEQLNESIYPNQIQDAELIYESLSNPHKLLVNLIKLPQEGKTGVVVYLLYLIAKNDVDYKFSIINTYYITGLSSTEWKGQMIQRFPSVFSNNILHRPELIKNGKLTSILSGEKNPFIIIDEAFWAAGANQTFSKILTETFGTVDRLNRYAERNLKILLTSATPDGTLPDTREIFGHYADVIVPEADRAYWGPCDWMSVINTRLHQYKDLWREKNRLDLRSFIEIFYNKPKYHLVRIHGAMRGENLVKAMESTFGCQDYLFYQFDEASKGDATFSNNGSSPDLNKLLRQKPTKHSFIFIKEKSRCSTTIVKDHIGVLYERIAKKPKNTIINQGFIGRLNGYDVKSDNVVFTDIDEVIKYVEYRENLKNGTESQILITSNTTYITRDETKSKGTYVNHTIENGRTKKERPNWGVVIFDEEGKTLRQLKFQFDEFLCDNDNKIYKYEERQNKNVKLKKNISNYCKQNDFWVLKTNYNKLPDGNYRIFATDELNTEHDALFNGQNNNITRLFPTYANVDDPTSKCTWKLFYRLP